MDSITHIFLGGAVAQSFFGKRLGRSAFLIGALAATIPDFDVFIHTGDVVRNHVLHRHFTHSLVMVPVLAALAILPFLFFRRLRPKWRTMYLAALLACSTHGALDVLTSYGTMLLWPFSNRRFALDIVAVVDATYTLILIVGACISLRRQSPRSARIALALSTLYLGFAAIQHGRAAVAQQELLAMRNHQGAENPRVLPKVGATLNYRSIYIFQGRIYADAIRVPPFFEARVRTGTSIERASVADVARSAGALGMVGPFDAFSWFADGFVARTPGSPETLGDMRYTATTEGFDAIWGVNLGGPTAVWHNAVRTGMFRKLWRDLIHPSGYLPLSSLAEHPADQ